MGNRRVTNSNATDIALDHVEASRHHLEAAEAALTGSRNSTLIGEVQDGLAATDAALLGRDSERVRGFEGQFTTTKGEVERRKK